MRKTWAVGDSIGFRTGARVSHVVGSSKHKRNWCKYWKDNSGEEWPEECRMIECYRKAQVGAHVYPVLQGCRQNFILPTCQKCNRDPSQRYGIGNREVKKGSRAVWAVRHANTYEDNSMEIIEFLHILIKGSLKDGYSKRKIMNDPIVKQYLTLYNKISGYLIDGLELDMIIEYWLLNPW